MKERAWHVVILTFLVGITFAFFTLRHGGNRHAVRMNLISDARQLAMNVIEADRAGALNIDQFLDERFEFHFRDTPRNLIEPSEIIFSSKEPIDQPVRWLVAYGDGSVRLLSESKYRRLLKQARLE